MFKIEKMENFHLEQVLEVSQQEFSSTSWHKNQFEAEINNPNSCAYVALRENEVVGFLNLLVLPDEITILNIATKNQYKRKGVASLFLQTIKQIAKKNNTRQIFLEVETFNEPALSFYQKHGFEILRRRDNYYSNGDSCYEMVLKLS